MKIKVKRLYSFWDSWLPLTVKLNGEKAGAVRNGDDTVIPLSEEQAEISVAYWYGRSGRVPVKAGDVITVKQNKKSHFMTLALILAVGILSLLLGTAQYTLSYILAMLVALGIIAVISQKIKSYDIERTGQLTEEELTEDEGVEGVHVRRTNGFFESALPLSVILNEEEKEKLKSGEQAVIPMKEDDAEMSVEFLYEAGNRVNVGTGDVIKLKRNWVFYLRLTLLFIVLIGSGILLLSGVDLNLEPVFYVTAGITALVILAGMSFMKTVKLEVVDKAH